MAGFVGAQQLGPGGFARATQLAPEIELEGRGKAGGEIVTGPAKRRDRGIGVVADHVTRGAAAAGDRRQLRARDIGEAGRSLLDATGRDADIGIILKRLLDERGQAGVAQTDPPVGGDGRAATLPFRKGRSGR